ncbi:Dyp-type peroxidase [Conexibacter woesei]|uniref:Dyp-type peroxidase n=1 Tax=Conexibacter woesei TaxID=191495 RepID=UPI0003F581A2|nr:Dyp-type peroxidase [Conexibacter woesei]
MTSRLDYADLQGDILRAHGNSYDRTSYVFVELPDPGAGRAWLSHLIPRVTSAAWRGAEGPDTALNVAFTAAGLTALGVPERVLETCSEEFLQGMAARARELGDAGPSAPERWEQGLGTGEAHVLVTVNAKGEQALTAALEELMAGIADHGLAIGHQHDAQLLAGAREHFGFADGGAQPAIEDVNEDQKNGGGTPDRKGGWRALALGEFVLGFEDEESRSAPRWRPRPMPSAPADPLGRHGTYMVWRKLYQDVALFRRTLRDAAERYHAGDEELLAAKVVGRWRDGSPLVTAPARPQPGFDPAAPGANDFRYGDDPLGLACPLGAHIRRSNPRDALDPEPGPDGGDGKLTFRHRIIRRGMPYGAPLPPGVLEDDEQDRGLVFVCFNASISRQFESIQRQWLNDGNVFHVGHDSDFLLGANERLGKMTVQGDPPFLLEPQAPFVVTRGGEYLFVPGITGLAAIADGVTG